MIQQGNVCTGLDMLVKQFLEILLEDHTAGGDDHIIMAGIFDDFDIVHVSRDIIAIQTVQFILCKKQMQSATLGVDIILTSGSQMLRK